MSLCVLCHEQRRIVEGASICRECSEQQSSIWAKHHVTGIELSYLPFCSSQEEEDEILAMIASGQGKPAITLDDPDIL